MKHRHLVVRPDTPAEELPSAAIVDLLERGDLGDWRPLAAAVARDPWGRLAERVLDLVNVYPRYGTSALWRAFVDRCRARSEGRGGAGQPATLASLRRDLGLTQEQVASRVGMSQSDLSKLERRGDVRLSSLRAYAEALGGSLRVLVELPDRSVAVTVGATGRAGDGHKPRGRRHKSGRPQRSA